MSTTHVRLYTQLFFFDQNCVKIVLYLFFFLYFFVHNSTKCCRQVDNIISHSHIIVAFYRSVIPARHLYKRKITPSFFRNDYQTRKKKLPTLWNLLRTTTFTVRKPISLTIQLLFDESKPAWILWHEIIWSNLSLRRLKGWSCE